MTSLVPPPEMKVNPTVSDHFSWIRTILSLDRTLMSATRTSVSLIGFGFTVAQFFDKIRTNLPQDIKGIRPDSPRILGLILIAAGVISLVIFALQYRTAVKYLREAQFEPILAKGEKPFRRPAYYSAVAVLLIGIAAFVAVFLRF